MFKLIKFILPAIFCHLSLHAAMEPVPTGTGAPAAAPTQAPQNNMSEAQQKALLQTVDITTKAANDWLALVDRGNYGESWETGAFTLRMIMSKEEWITTLNGLRKNLGNVRKREIIDIRTSQDPQGVPRGEYMVYVYETTFSNGRQATEILTLQENKGKWNVMTYVVSPK